jgi:uncharacterized protein involved in response to NO
MDGAIAARRKSWWQLLSSAPHRMMFFAGAVQSVAVMAWWLAELLARYGGLYPAPAWSVAPMFVHAYLMIYGFLPFFIFGFLMTVTPNWLSSMQVPRACFVPAALLMAAGVVLIYAGLGAGRPLLAAGVATQLAGWLWGGQGLLRLMAGNQTANTRYAAILLTLLAMGALGSAAFLVWLAGGHYWFRAFALEAGVWFFLLPTFLVVSNRMVPFFSSRILDDYEVYRPAWSVPALLAACVAHGVLELAGARAWLWLVDAPFAVVVAYLAWKWGFPRSFRVHLLAVLHISLAVLTAALLLYVVQAVSEFAGAAPPLGLAPQHLLAIGYFGAMMMGMVSRVSLGHSGRPLVADRLTWWCYLGVLLTAALRVAAELAPVGGTRSALMMAAAALWLSVFALWTWRYLPMYVTPRVDAR